MVEGAKGKEGKAKEGKPKGTEKGNEKGKGKAGGVGNGFLLPDMLLEDICVLFASFSFWSPDWRSMG